MRGVPDLLTRGQAPPIDPRAGPPSLSLSLLGLFLTAQRQDTSQLVRLHSARPGFTPYMCFDEAYFKTLESMQWNRDNGCVELIPIVVGLP